ncbi:serine protease [Allokutzneria sp. A3M-2-11 16]|nr:serine protease [Allokutzneria sp. A3M-2-11 16]
MAVALLMASGAGSAGAIVKGRDATGPYPFMASAQFPAAGKDGEHFCGAALIAARWLVTAGHCAQGIVPGKTFYRIGSLDRTKGGSYVGVRSAHLHPEYSAGETALLNDIMLVELVEAVPLRPARIDGAVGVPGAGYRALGWGITCQTASHTACPGVERPVVLQEADYAAAPDAKCTDLAAGKELCAAPVKAGSGVCNQDSGGPLVRRDVFGDWQLLGVTSRQANQVVTCGGGFGIWTAIAGHRAWIEKTVAA